MARCLKDSDYMARPPRPKVMDDVDKADFSRTLGRVTRIVDNKRVEVWWNDKNKPEKKVEKIDTLAIVGRHPRPSAKDRAKFRKMVSGK